MKKTIGFVACFICFSKIFIGQNEIHKVTGVITDTLNAAIPFANIYIKRTDTSSIIAFGASDVTGKFSINLPKAKVVLIFVSSLGYETQRKVIESENGIFNAVHFYLATKNLILKETVVRANARVVERGDTVTFNADKFRDSTERNVEDLLAKLPGVDVDKNTGVISVQGKPIKKILLEGDDLTGRNYQLLSKNMGADVVDKIQIIDKFVENKMLHGLKRSEDKVINLTLKNNKNKLLFGNVKIGIGNDERTNDNANIFGIYKKFKTITFAGFNTEGNPSTADIISVSDFKDDTEAENLHSLIKSKNKPLIDIGTLPVLSLKSQSVRFNRAGIVASNWILRPTEKLYFKAVVNITGDKLRSYTDNQYLYHLPDTSFSYTESNAVERRPTIFETHFEMQADLSSRTLLRVKSDFRSSLSKNFATTLLNTDSVFNALNTDIRGFSNSLDLTFRPSEHQAFFINASYLTDNNTQEYNINNNSLRLIPIIQTPEDALSQRIIHPAKYFTTNAQWYYADSDFKIALYAGNVIRGEDFSSDAQAFFRSKSENLGGNFSNNNFYQQANQFIGLNTSKDIYGIQFFTDVSAGYYKINFADSILKGNFYVVPTIGLKKKFLKKHQVFASYTFNTSLPQLPDLVSGYIFNDYRNIIKGDRTFSPSYSNGGILNYTYGNFEDEFLAHLNVFYFSNSGGYRNNLSVNPFFYVSEKTKNIFPNNSTNISASIERYFKKIYLRIKLTPRMAFGSYYNTLNGSDIRKSETINTGTDISIRSGYLKWFNFHAGASLSVYNVKTKFLESVSDVQSKTVSSFVDFYLRFNKNFLGKINNEFYYAQSPNTLPQKYLFANASLTYFNPTNQKWNFTFSLNNILNTSSFNLTSINDFSAQTTSIKLLPRYFLFEIDFKF